MEFTVFACCLDEKSYGALGLQSIGNETGRLNVIRMDVTSQEDVEQARKIVESRLPEQGLWGIVNNAGVYTVGFLEWLPMEAYESVCNFSYFYVKKSF